MKRLIMTVSALAILTSSPALARKQNTNGEGGSIATSTPTHTQDNSATNNNDPGFSTNEDDSFYTPTSIPVGDSTPVIPIINNHKLHRDVKLNNNGGPGTNGQLGNGENSNAKTNEIQADNSATGEGNGSTGVTTAQTFAEGSVQHGNQPAKKVLTPANFKVETQRDPIYVLFYDPSGENYKSLQKAADQFISSSPYQSASFDCTQDPKSVFCPPKPNLPSVVYYFNGSPMMKCDKSCLMNFITEEYNKPKPKAIQISKTQKPGGTGTGNKPTADDSSKKLKNQEAFEKPAVQNENQTEPDNNPQIIKNNDGTKVETTDAGTQTSEKLNGNKLANGDTVTTTPLNPPLKFDIQQNVVEGIPCEDLTYDRCKKAIWSFILIRLYYGEEREHIEEWFSLVERYQSNDIPLQFAQINCEKVSEVCQKYSSSQSFSQSSTSTSSRDRVIVFMDGKKVAGKTIIKQNWKCSSKNLQNLVSNALQTYKHRYSKGNQNSKRILRGDSSRKVNWNRHYGFSSRNGDSHRTVNSKKIINHFPGARQKTKVSRTSYGSSHTGFGNNNQFSQNSVDSYGKYEYEESCPDDEDNNRILGCTLGCHSGHLENLNAIFKNGNANGGNFQTTWLGNSWNSCLNAVGVVCCKKLCNPYPNMNPCPSSKSNGITNIPVTVSQPKIVDNKSKKPGNHVETKKRLKIM